LVGALIENVDLSTIFSIISFICGSHCYTTSSWYCVFKLLLVMNMYLMFCAMGVLHLVVWRRAHVLFMLFVFACA